MKLTGRITSVHKKENYFDVNVRIPLDKVYLIERWRADEVSILLEDKRSITPKQRRYIYALCGDISRWSGEPRDEVPTTMKHAFLEEGGLEYFSVSDTSITIANLYIFFLVTFCIKNSVPSKENLMNYIDDCYAYVYLCALNKVSCISRRPAELHHLDAVGMGNDRKSIIHKGMAVLPLTREEHIKAHKIGKQTFLYTYHLVEIILNDELCQIWNLRK